MVSYGGFAGGILAIAAYARVSRITFLGVLDAVAPCLALGEAFSRVGCFIAGCCWGCVTHVPWAVRFPGGSHAFAAQVHLNMIPLDEPESLPVHPTQLYMLAGLLVVTALLLAADRLKRINGQTTCGYLLLYGILRFTVEIFRDAAQAGDSERLVGGYMTISQSISIACIVLGVTGLYLSSLSARRSLPRLQEYVGRALSMRKIEAVPGREPSRQESLQFSASADEDEIATNGTT